MLVALFARLRLRLVGSRLLQGGTKRVRERHRQFGHCLHDLCRFFFFLYSGVAIYWIPAERCLPGFHI